MGEYKPTIGTKEDKMEKVELNPEEEYVGKRSENVSKVFDRRVIKDCELHETNLEEAVKQVEDPANWNEERQYYSYDGYFPCVTNFYEYVYSNTCFALGLEESIIDNHDLVQLILKEALKKEPRIRTFIKGVIIGLEKQTQIQAKHMEKEGKDKKEIEAFLNAPKVIRERFFGF